MDQTKSYNISKWQFVRAFELVKANAGAAGIDRQTIAEYEGNLQDNLYKLWNRMSSGSYFPPAVLAVAIPKKTGGERILGIPTVGDRVAQMVVKLELEPVLEPHFLPDSYGYRPNKSALDAIGVTRQRCWRYDWVVEFDIKGLFDNIPHNLLMKAVYKHTEIEWVRLYIQRWLTAPLQLHSGSVEARTKGTPQGGVISPLLSNLFLHYAFDKWMQRSHPDMPWCRYADDGLVHCRSKEDAEMLLASLELRLRDCGLEIHPVKTKIVYCKDGERKGRYKNTSFDFLGYTFRRRISKNSKRNTLFVNFTPAVSKSSMKSMRQKIRKLRVRSRTELSIAQMADWLNPIINGWLRYYAHYCKSAMYGMCRYINTSLVRWAQRKYKALRRHKSNAGQFLKELSESIPGLFAHWKAGMVCGVTGMVVS